jgi:hypothetical protein
MRMLIAVNRTYTNRPVSEDKEVRRAEYRAINKTFENLDIAIADLANEVGNGHAFCAQHKKRWRASPNFLGAGFLAVDVDYGLRIEEALAHPFVQQYGGLLYTSGRHTNEKHRFRVVFELEKPITDEIEMKRAYTGLLSKFGADPSCKDACRMFFGNTAAQVKLLGGAPLPAEEVGTLITRGKEIKTSAETLGRTQASAATTHSRVILQSDLLVTDTSGTQHPLADLPAMTPIHCPVHVDRNPSAVTIRSKRGTPGVYCSSCNASFYLRKEGPFYDFDYDLKVLRDLARRPTEDSMIASMEADNPEDAASAAHSTGICFVNEPFLPPVQADADIVLIKSPKGSGKTEWLTRVVRDARQNGQSVLLIGHRQMLIMSTAKRLGLTPYITMKRQSAEDEPKIAYNKPDRHFAVCIDSLPTRLDPRINKYDVILIDEVEQVLAHLTSDTLREQRNNAITFLGHYLRQSKKAYLLDADLNRVTGVCIPELLDSVTPVRKMALVVINEYAAPRGSMQLYNDKGHLIQQLYSHLAEGKRCFVCANSRKEVNALGKALQESFKESKKFKVITGENSQTAGAQEFLLSLPNSMLEYDCVLVSPAVGTGIDITFPNGETRIDAVFGLFSPRVNTHFDIDQQLCRVRHPGSVHVWISPQKFRFSTERKLILSELKVSALRNGFQYAGLNADGSPIYSDADQKYMRIFSEVRAAARASKNELREHFCALRKFSGWDIDVLERDVAASKDGNELAKFGKEMAAEERVRRSEALPMRC